VEHQRRRDREQDQRHCRLAREQAEQQRDASAQFDRNRAGCKRRTEPVEPAVETARSRAECHHLADAAVQIERNDGDA
jgi:hypothetical protein